MFWVDRGPSSYRIIFYPGDLSDGLSYGSFCEIYSSRQGDHPVSQLHNRPWGPSHRIIIHPRVSFTNSGTILSFHLIVNHNRIYRITEAGSPNLELSAACAITQPTKPMFITQLLRPVLGL